ncbi:MAG: 2-amino-4-hydroxy-6-hydroxymethyldihydropteridine diphosphokinase [Xanthomonadales bacterium]|nr:2-amino-4-hydroxy-6-hydroxymethyldihydropteridine diphosphokinase [Xanthomonadales bacterium]
MKAWIGLGSNVGDRSAEIERALAHLSRHPDIVVLRRSSSWRTAAWGREEQRDFHNAVAELETALAPAQLLRVLLETENELGRDRSGPRWGPRRIDLDLLLAEERVLDQPGLSVPHPRMHQRAFVLAPLNELDPDLPIPGHGTVRECLRTLAAQPVERIQAPGQA